MLNSLFGVLTGVVSTGVTGVTGVAGVVFTGAAGVTGAAGLVVFFFFVQDKITITTKITPAAAIPIMLYMLYNSNSNEIVFNFSLVNDQLKFLPSFSTFVALLSNALYGNVTLKLKSIFPIELVIPSKALLKSSLSSSPSVVISSLVSPKVISEDKSSINLSASESKSSNNPSLSVDSVSLVSSLSSLLISLSEASNIKLAT